MSVSALASWSTWTSRNSDSSPTAATGEHTVGQLATEPLARTPGSVTTTSVVDDHSRLAYSEIHSDEKAGTTTDFFARAIAFFAANGITIERV